MSTPRLVVDTNVVSFLFKGHPLASEYRPLIAAQKCGISFMTLAELYEGGYRAGWNDARWNSLKKDLQQYVILESYDAVSETWAWVRSERRFRPISTDDAWIAATALVYDCKLVTHNPEDFEDIHGLHVLSAIR